jgi:hypothetical protein
MLASSVDICQGVHILSDE